MFVFFTGFTGVAPTRLPLYVTLISGSGTTSAMGYSYLSGVVATTHFRNPTGTSFHGENSGDSGWRLAPNFAPANYYGTNVLSAVTGGEYPALSLDNGLELYLDISWSSPCGTAVKGGTCNEPV